MKGRIQCYFFENVNVSDITGKPIEVNALYRYGSVFGALISEDMDYYPELRQTLFDILAHYLSGLDLRSGMCRDEYHARFLMEDIAAGIFGQENACCLKCFGRKEKRIVLSLIRLDTETHGNCRKNKTENRTLSHHSVALNPCGISARATASPVWITT